MSDHTSSPESTGDPRAQAQLDRLVAEAYRLPVDEMRVARLAQAWRRERQSTRFHGWARSLAAAASIALIGAIVWGTIDQPVRVPAVEQRQAAGPPQAPELVAEIAAPEARPAVGQAPDRLREVLFSVRTQKRPGRSVPLAELLTQHQSHSVAMARQEILTATGWRPAELDRRLEHELPQLPIESQRLAIALLAHDGDEAASRVLQRLAKQDNLRPLCLEQLFEITGGEDPGVLLQAANCTQVAEWLLQGAAKDARRVECYLALVAHPATRNEALGALREMAEPPVSSFVAAIDSDQRQVRFAAALALGQLGGSEVAQPLIELVTGHNRRNAEAWLAIVACDSPLAEEFLAYAARDPLLLGHYNAARLRQQQLSP